MTHCTDWTGNAAYHAMRRCNYDKIHRIQEHERCQAGFVAAANAGFYAVAKIGAGAE